MCVEGHLRSYEKVAAVIAVTGKERLHVGLERIAHIVRQCEQIVAIDT